MAKGYVKVHRDLMDWEWYKDINTKVLFLHLILKANHKDVRRRGVLYKAGECVTTLKELSEETGLSIQQTRTALNHLKSTQEITQRVTNRKSVITIVNYGFYQNKETKATQKAIQKATTYQQTETQKSTNVYNKNDLNKNEEEYIVENVGYKPIIDYLNSKTGKSYRPSTRKTQGLIKARMNEGFTEPDFFRVIDNKVASWQGTKMDKFLRPETLFGNKFEGYLNEQQTMSDFEKAQRELDEEIRRLEDERD